MAATLAEHVPSGKNWLYEIKWDGVRALCFIENGEVHILSRTGNRCDRQYPELLVLPHYVRASRRFSMAKSRCSTTKDARASA